MQVLEWVEFTKAAEKYLEANEWERNEQDSSKWDDIDGRFTACDFHYAVYVQLEIDEMKRDKLAKEYLDGIKERFT